MLRTGWTNTSKLPLAPGDIISVRVDFGGDRNFFWLQAIDDAQNQLFETNTQDWFQYVPEDEDQWWIITNENLKKLRLGKAAVAKVGNYSVQARKAILENHGERDAMLIGSSVDHNGRGYLCHIVTAEDLSGLKTLTRISHGNW